MQQCENRAHNGAQTFQGRVEGQGSRTIGEMDGKCVKKREVKKGGDEDLATGQSVDGNMIY